MKVSSFSYHIINLYFFSSTNQTTLENIAPFMLLRHLPPLPRSGHSLSDPPLEAELSPVQRRIVRDAHGQILIYDVGWKRNWAQVFGWNRNLGWFTRLWYGGAWWVPYTINLVHFEDIFCFTAWGTENHSHGILGQKRCWQSLQTSWLRLMWIADEIHEAWVTYKDYTYIISPDYQTLIEVSFYISLCPMISGEYWIHFLCNSP